MVSADGGLPPCAIEINNAGGGKLTDDEILEIAEAIQKRRMKLEAEGKIDNIDQRLAEIAREEGDKARLAAALQKKQTALTIIARDRADNHVQQLIGQGLTPEQAVLAMFEGSVKGVNLARKSIYATKQAFESRYIGNMVAQIEQEVPVARKLLRDREFASDVLREMYEIKDGGHTGITGNADAQKVARIFATHAEVARTDLNRLGANIGKLDGWSPQAHDATKLMATNDDDWARAIMPRLDLDRSFEGLTPAEAYAALKEIYLTITTGKDNKISARRQVKVTGPASLAKSLGKERVLHFKTADDWLAYNEQFGVGNAISAMLNHQRRAASIAAQMQALGPNPELMLGSLLDQMQERIKRDTTMSVKDRDKAIARLSTEDTKIGQALLEAEGFTLSANRAGLKAARVGSGLRAVQSMSKLGFAVASSIGDMVTQAANLKYQGVPLLRSYHDQTVDMIRNVSRDLSTDERRVAYLAGEGFDGLIDHIASSTFANDGLPGFMSDNMTRFFRWSGLTAWTDGIRAAGARIMAAELGQQAAKSWGKLSDQYRFVLGQHGIGENEWKIIQQAGFKADNGRTYVTPDRIADLPDEAFSSLIDGKKTAGKIARVKLDTELALRRFFADEIGFGVIETDARSRRFTLRGTRAGTATGEILRYMTQFKGWPIAFSQRVLGRAIYGQRNGLVSAQSAMHIGHLVAGLTVAGYLAMTAKDYARGYDRRKFVEPDGSLNLKTLQAAFLQGGGAGIYGDFLFGQVNRFGGGLAETVIGPAPGAVFDLGDLLMKARDGDASAADGLNYILQNTPYANLHLVRPVVDYLGLNALRDALSPGFLQRQASKRKKEYGQTLWHKQTVQ